MNLAKLHFFVLNFCFPWALSAQSPDRLEFNSQIDIPWLSAGVLGSLGLVLFEKDLAPEDCRWCEPPAFDREIQEKLRWENPDRAHLLSHITGYGLIPLSALTVSSLSQRSNASATLWMNAVLMLEAATTAEILAKSVQFLTGRRRPSSYFQNPRSPTAEDHTSFFSGHTSVAFAMAVAAGTQAEITEQTLKNWTWGLGLTLATATAYFRIASDHHYFSDTVVAAGVGSLVGFMTPHLRMKFQSSFYREAQVQLSPLPQGLAAQLRW